MCEATGQAVHVSEHSSSWLRGANSPLVVGAYCEAHFGQQLRVIGDNWSVDQYTEWTIKNVEQQFILIAPDKPDYLVSIRDALNKSA